MTSMKKQGNITEEVKKYPRLYNKPENDYKHEDVEKSLRTAIGKTLEVKREAAKVDFLCLLFPYVKLQKQI